MAENRWFIVAGSTYFKSGVLGKIIGPRKAHVLTEQWSSIFSFCSQKPPLYALALQSGGPNLTFI